MFANRQAFSCLFGHDLKGMGFLSLPPSVLSRLVEEGLKGEGP
jgi:hypothetical protein